MEKKLYDTTLGNGAIPVYETQNPSDLVRLIEDKSIKHFFGLSIDSGTSVKGIRDELNALGYNLPVSRRKDNEGREFLCIIKRI